MNNNKSASDNLLDSFLKMVILPMMLFYFGLPVGAMLIQTFFGTPSTQTEMIEELDLPENIESRSLSGEVWLLKGGKCYRKFAGTSIEVMSKRKGLVYVHIKQCP